MQCIDEKFNSSFNRIKFFVECAKIHLFVEHIEFYHTFATLMRNQTTNINWWHFTTNVVDS